MPLADPFDAPSWPIESPLIDRMFKYCFSLIIASLLLIQCVALSLSRDSAGRSPLTTDAKEHRVGIVGAGAIAMATAAILSRNGHDPMLLSPSGRQLQDRIKATNAIDISLQPRVATSCQEIVEENDVVIIALPANGHRKVFEDIAPYLSDRHHVIISSHSSLGALYLSKCIRERYSNVPPITAWGTTACTARRQADESEVRINTIRTTVDFCTVPSTQTNDGLRLCQTLFPTIDFAPRDGLLAISLSNLNPQNHLGIALGNMSRMEKGEAWWQSANITPNIGRLLEQLDQERLEIAKALGFKVKSIFEHFSYSFHVPLSDNISDMNQKIHELGNDVYGPNTASSRYVTEDVPFGLPLTVYLGKIVNRPATLHQAGIQICSALYGRDFSAENDILAALDLEKYSLEELQEASLTGYLRQKVSS